MHKVLILISSVPAQSAVSPFHESLSPELPGTQVEATSLRKLTFLIDGGKATIKDLKQGFDVADFDLVVFRTVGKYLEEAIAVAAYCRKNDIPYIDQYIPAIGNRKLSCAFVRWEHGLTVPGTAYGPLNGLLQAAEAFGYPVILKADAGKKGRDNYLLDTADEIAVHVNEPDAPAFVLQQFIANDGDYRVLVFNGKPVMAIKRRAAGESHLNNTSQGGTAEQIDMTTLSKDMLELSVQAAGLEKLAIAGVDIVVDKHTGKPYILEVNRAPQITTGAFAQEKLQHYADALLELLQKGDAV